MKRFIFLATLILSCTFSTIYAFSGTDYILYHQRIQEAETFIAAEKYDTALRIYEELFTNYEFVFLRDYQIATQIALHLGNEQEAFQYLKKGMAAGWSMKSIKKNVYLKKIRKHKDWKTAKKQYPSLHQSYQNRLNHPYRKQVQKMFSKDQWKALGAFIKLSSDAQDEYAEKKFAPHSEKQLSLFFELFSEHGYPGEKLIGNNFWMSTVLSHHNSISTDYNRKDTLYQKVKPLLKDALKKGEISAFEFILIDEWSRASQKKSSEPTYGILKGPLLKDLEETNRLRKKQFLRSIEAHNKMVEIEDKTGMNFYLEGHPWGKEAIEIRP